MVIEADEGWKALADKAGTTAVESQEAGATSSERQTTLGRILCRALLIASIFHSIFTMSFRARRCSVQSAWGETERRDGCDGAEEAGRDVLVCKSLTSLRSASNLRRCNELFSSSPVS